MALAEGNSSRKDSTMNRSLWVSLLSLCLLLAAMPLPAQQPTLYAVITYFDVEAEQDAAYRAHVTSTSKKFYQEMMAANPNLVHWSLSRVVYPGVDADYNYLGVTVYNGPPPESANAAADATAKKIAGVPLTEYMKKLYPLRKTVGSELLMRVAGTANPGAGVSKEGDYRVTYRLKIKPTMLDEFTAQIQSMTLPIMQERVKAGDLKSYSSWTRVFPMGGEDAYDALSSLTYKDLASAVKGLDTSKTAANFVKAHPGKNYATYLNNSREYSEFTGRILSQVIVLVER
jgi:hypothetical protein